MEEESQKDSIMDEDGAVAENYRKRISGSLSLHPRVEYQDVVKASEDRQRFSSQVPDLVPFGSNEYHEFLPILDWDHQLPSKQFFLRVYAYYTPESYELGKADLEARFAKIKRMDKYPEFDVPDFSDMLADEAYEITLDSDGKRKSCRLTSTWRRELDANKAASAAAVVKKSREFAKINSSFKKRPENLGDAEAVSWTPPCESSYENWTMDVWYLVAYDGMHGKGRSFLVDLEKKKIVAVREFTVRPD